MPAAPVLRRTHSYAVWEITLKCNLACSHCGSRAGEARSNELSTAEAMDLVQQLADCGITEVSLIGGEAFLRRDWLDIARAVTAAGMMCTMTTGGFGVSAGTAKKMKEAGIATVSVSVDGLEATHDKLRGVPGSWQSCFRTIKFLREAGINVGTNSQINRLSAPELPQLYELLLAAGFFAWQLQLTVPMGNAADHNEILLQPVELLDVYPMLAVMAKRAYADGVAINAGNNIGYYGPYELLLRNAGEPTRDAIWQGCQAGLSTLGIEADGAIKGCPSLPTRPYTGANIRDMKLRDIVLKTPELNINQGQGTDLGVEHLWGFCASCDYANLCRGGCSWTAHVFFDRRGNNPYCHHRALEQKRMGVRERFSQTEKASGFPFDNGVFKLWEEPFGDSWPAHDSGHFKAEHILWGPGWSKYLEEFGWTR